MEALVDVHVELAGSPPLERLPEVMRGDEELRYPARQTMVETFWDLTPAVSGAVASQHNTVGLSYSNEPRTRVVQLRRNGFAFSQLRPYPTNGWAEWHQEAKRLWRRYADVMQPVAVTRVAVRYINQIPIPLSTFRPEQFFRTYPAIPDDLGLIGNFLLRAEMILPGSPEARLQITQGIVANPAHTTGPTFLMDLDASSVLRIEAQEDAVWAALDRLHGAIGPSFEASITEETRALFK